MCRFIAIDLISLNKVLADDQEALVHAIEQNIVLLEVFLHLVLQLLDVNQGSSEERLD